MLIKNLPSQEVNWLKIKDKPEVLVLFKNSSSVEVKGGVIILHDFDSNPNWPVIVQPLRNYLPRYRWATLSIFMPTYPEAEYPVQIDNLYKETAGRITTGINFLKDKNINPTVIIAQGRTAGMALKYAAENASNNTIQSMVLISAQDIKSIVTSEILATVPNNVLDIIAENDWQEVHLSAKSRLNNANLAGKLKEPPPNLVKSQKVKSLILNKTGNLRYRQEIIAGASHSFDKQHDELLKTIRGWMEKYRND